jgi:hypothetical protein
MMTHTGNASRWPGGYIQETQVGGREVGRRQGAEVVVPRLWA